MKFIKKSIVYMLVITILCMSFSLPLCVYASDSNNIPSWVFDDNGELTRQGKMFLMQHAMAKNGFIFNISDYMEDDELYNAIMETDPFNVKRDLDNPAKILSVSISKEGLTKLYDIVKDKTKNKYGYTYISTVPQSAFVTSMFKNEEYYNRFKNIMKNSNGVIYAKVDGGTGGYYFKSAILPSVSEFVLIKQSFNIYARFQVLDLYGASFKNKLPYTITGEISGTYSNDLNYCSGMDCYSYYRSKGDGNPMNTSANYLISTTPMTLPYFDTLKAFQDYQLDKGGYYVSNKFDGTLSDITINVNELENLDFYNKLITDLYDQIRTSDIDYNEIANMVDKLANEINQGLDEVKHETQIGNTWLEKIYNAIIDLSNKITHSDNNSNDIDLTELNNSLTTVINKLDTINSKLNNIDTDNDNEKLTDIETAITDNKAVLNSIKTELTSQSVDIKEISTQLQSVADSLKDLSSDVDTINTELINVSNQLDNISKSLNDLAVTLENIEKELKDTNGLLADIKDTLKAIKNWLVADTIFDGIDLISDLAEFINEFMSDIDTGIATISSGLSEVAETFTKKFPFSIPWDILFLIEFLADTPATPVFELPLKFDSFGINEIIKIDFTRFEIISKISRLLLTMLFTLGLAKFTYNIISVKQGDN